MSVFSVDPKAGSLVTTDVLDDVCRGLGVTLRDDEKEDYRKLLAVFDETAQDIMAMPGWSCSVVSADAWTLTQGQTTCQPSI